MAGLDPSLKFLEGGRYIFFGVAVVLIMMLRPEGVITRTLTERWGGSRKAQVPT
jgi:ABC-type branched-subunit amino acid transport system permease subunit